LLEFVGDLLEADIVASDEHEIEPAGCEICIDRHIISDVPSDTEVPRARHYHRALEPTI